MYLLLIRIKRAAHISFPTAKRGSLVHLNGERSTQESTGDLVPQRIHAGQFGICMGHFFEGLFAMLKFLLNGSALRSADLNEVVFGVLAFLDYSPYVSFKLLIPTKSITITLQ